MFRLLLILKMENNHNAFIYINKSVKSDKYIAVKDNIAVAGMPLTCASEVLKDYVCPYNAKAVDKLIKSGYEIVGKTNMDEFGMGNTGNNSAFMITENPRHPGYTTGGSSSGSAAAVAAGLCKAALATDTGGSVRVPSACCDIIGFKPSYNAVSRYGLVAYASSMDVIGILAADISDIIDIFNIIRETPYIEPAKAKIKEFSFSDVDKMLDTYFSIISYEAYSNLNRFDGLRYGKNGNLFFGKTVTDRIVPCSRAKYESALEYRKKLIESVSEIFGDADILKFPTLSDGSDDNYNVFANLTGLPAISIPTGNMQGIELMAKRNQDDLLLQAAKEVLKS